MPQIAMARKQSLQASSSMALDGFSSDDISYLQEVGALRLFRSMMCDLVAMRPPDRKSLVQTLRRCLTQWELANDSAVISAGVLTAFRANDTGIVPRKVIERVLQQAGMADANVKLYLDALEVQRPGGLSYEDFVSETFCIDVAGASPKKLNNDDAESLFWQRINGQDKDFDKYGLKFLRQDALTKRWVLFNLMPGAVAKHKPTQYAQGNRTDPRAHEQPKYAKHCPFCVGREEQGEVLRVWPDGTLTEREGLPEAEEDAKKWLVRVLRNPFPYLVQPHGFDVYQKPFHGDPEKFPACFGHHANLATNPNPDHPMYQQTDGFGASEVVVETPVHNGLIGISTAAQVSHSLRALAARGRALRTSQIVKQIVYFKQYGSEASGSLVHPHMQICTLPIISGYLQARLQNHRDFYDRFGVSATQELYVNAVCGDVIASSRLVQASTHFVASCPYAKVAGGRVVIAPRRHCSRFEDSTEEELMDLGAVLQTVMAALYRVYDDPAYNLFWETAPPEQALDNISDVEKSFCWTLHVRIPRKISGFTLACGVHMSTAELPEDTAKKLREAIALEETSPIRDEVRA